MTRVKARFGVIIGVRTMGRNKVMDRVKIRAGARAMTISKVRTKVLGLTFYMIMTNR